MSQFERIEKIKLSLQEKKIEKNLNNNSNSNNNSDSNVRTENKNKNKNRKIKKKYGPKPETPRNVPPETNNNKPLTKFQRERQNIESKRKEYNLKPDSRGVYKPTKSGLKKSLEKQITYSSTPPKPSAKKTPEAIKKFNQQVRKSEKYSGNENQKRVKKLVDRAYKNQKIDKTKAGLVQRMKDVAYGKNPYEKKFGSTALNVQKKYDKQMIEVGGKLSKFQTPKQLKKLKTKIASKPAEKTMTYLSPAGSGKPVPLKTKRIRKKINTKPIQFDGKSFDAFMKDSERKRKEALQSVKNIKVEPVTKVGSKVSVGNQIPFVQPGPKRIPDPTKVKRIKAIRSQPKFIRNISKVTRKIPNRYKALGVALGTLGAVYGASKLVGSGTKSKKSIIPVGAPKDVNLVPVTANLNLSKGSRPTFTTKDSAGKMVPVEKLYKNAGMGKNNK